MNYETTISEAEEFNAPVAKSVKASDFHSDIAVSNTVRSTMKNWNRIVIKDTTACGFGQYCPGCICR